MNKLFPPIFCAMFLVACSASPEAEPQVTTQESPAAQVSGEDAYLQYCAGCHETGMLGAPIVGESSAWGDRSQLWQAVVMEHAKTGYLDMPAKGSRPDLSDPTIDAAVEYMLEITFTDMPPD